jgi:ubiquitin-protein ligase
LKNENDSTLTKWIAELFDLSGKELSLEFFCDDEYPTNPPNIRISNPPNKNFIDYSGWIINEQITLFRNWKKNTSFVHFLVKLKRLLL